MKRLSIKLLNGCAYAIHEANGIIEPRLLLVLESTACNPDTLLPVWWLHSGNWYLLRVLRSDCGLLEDWEYDLWESHHSILMEMTSSLWSKTHSPSFNFFKISGRTIFWFPDMMVSSNIMSTRLQRSSKHCSRYVIINKWSICFEFSWSLRKC